MKRLLATEAGRPMTMIDVPDDAAEVLARAAMINGADSVVIFRQASDSTGQPVWVPQGEWIVKGAKGITTKQPSARENDN